MAAPLVYPEPIGPFIDELLAVITAARIFHSVPALPGFESDGRKLEANLLSMIAQLNARTDVVPGLKDYLEEVNGIRRRIMEAQQTDDDSWIRSRINGILGDLVNLTIAIDGLSGVFPRP